MKLNYEVLVDVLEWAEALKGNELVRIVGKEGDISVHPTQLLWDHVRLCIVSGWLDGDANALEVRGLTIKGHSVLLGYDVEQTLLKRPQ